ncbi:hypothetical protein OIU77_024720 [Salix suchowensis]|uniref:Uncharacterized protein n=1 Tax=Salix suchowensis TaxID=1278906 RepID=A0ABQ9BTR5_9ROSI|nr:hypothetical protein OIU77_024720 [Salix suchowensis]
MSFQSSLTTHTEPYLCYPILRNSTPQVTRTLSVLTYVTSDDSMLRRSRRRFKEAESAAGIFEPLISSGVLIERPRWRRVRWPGTLSITQGVILT